MAAGFRLPAMGKDVLDADTAVRADSPAGYPPLIETLNQMRVREVTWRNDPTAAPCSVNPLRGLRAVIQIKLPTKPGRSPFLQDGAPGTWQSNSRQPPYGNLAIAHAAVEDGKARCEPLHYTPVVA